MLAGCRLGADRIKCCLVIRFCHLLCLLAQPPNFLRDLGHSALQFEQFILDPELADLQFPKSRADVQHMVDCLAFASAESALIAVLDSNSFRVSSERAMLCDTPKRLLSSRISQLLVRFVIALSSHSPLVQSGSLLAAQRSQVPEVPHFVMSRTPS